MSLPRCLDQPSPSPEYRRQPSATTIARSVGKFSLNVGRRGAGRANSTARCSVQT